MNKFNNLEKIIKSKDWKSLTQNFSPHFLAKKFSFINGLLLSRMLLENEDFDDEMQTFAINLIKSIREIHQKEWELDWRHDAYLGYAYDLRGWDYEEQFDAYQRAAKKSQTPDPEVLMRMAMNWSCPGVYREKINERQAIELLETALKKTPYIEGVSWLVNLYHETGDVDKRDYWQQVLKNSERENLHAPYAFLDFFKKYGWTNQ